MAPRVPTAAQLSLLRQRPHRTRVWLSIYQPGTVFASQINMPAIAKGERVITIASLGGDPNSVARNMTCYIGTTPGAQDQGRMRVISATSGQVTLAENAVDWVDGWYLTVLEYMEPWAVFPRILLTNNIPAFFKDYDIAYTDQNLYMDPVVCMGPNEAGFLVTGAFGVYYSSSGTFDPTDGSIPTGYSWYFEGGTPTGSGLRDPGEVQYTGAGHFMTSLTVTANSGKQFTGRRFVSVYTRPDEGPAFPILKWGFTSFEGARDNGGWSVRFFVREPEDFTKVKDGSLVVLFTDDWQGTVPGKLGANAENRDNILFCGYIEDESITIDPVTNRLEFRAASVTNIASKLSTYSATLESKPGAQTWNEMTEMTIDKAVVHFLRWHSTILGVADFSPTGDAKPVQYADFSRGGLYEAVNGLVSSALLGAIVSDRQGKMWAEIDLNVTPTGSARLAAAGVGTPLGRQDWRNRLDILRTWRPDTAYVELGGIAYNGPTTGTNEPYLAGSPGDVADYWGSVERTQGLVLASQTQLNELVGLYRANRNLNFKEVTVPLAGDYRFLDIAPQARVLLSISPSDNWRGLTWVDKPFIPQQLTYQYTAERQTLVLDARVKEEASSPPGTTIVIPVEPPYDEPGLPGWEITFPPIPPFPGFPPPIVPQPPDGNTVYLPTTDGYLYRSRNFWSTTPTWTKIVNGVAGGTGVVLWWLNMNDPVNGAFMFIPGANGPLGYMTNTLDAPVPTWVPMWTDSDTTAVFGGLSSQIKFLDMHQEPGLGYFIAVASQGAIGTPPAFVYGAPGGWTKVNMNNNNFGALNDSLHNVRLLSGSRMAATFNRRLYTSPNLGVSQFGWQFVDPSANSNSKGNIIALGGNNVLWADDGRQSGASPEGWPAVWFNTDGWSPTDSNIWGRSTRISIPFGANLFSIKNGTGPSMNFAQRMVHDGGSKVYGSLTLFLTAGVGSWTSGWAFAVKDAGPGGWTRLYQNTSFDLYPLALFLPKPTWLAGMRHYVTTPASQNKVVGTQDGGASWLDKTGNLAALRTADGLDMDFQGAPKFAGVFSMY